MINIAVALLLLSSILALDILVYKKAYNKGYHDGCRNTYEIMARLNESEIGLYKELYK